MEAFRLWTVNHGPFKVQQFENTPQWTVYLDTDTTDCYAWTLLPEQMRALIDVLKKTLDIVQEEHENNLTEKRP